MVERPAGVHLNAIWSAARPHTHIVDRYFFRHRSAVTHSSFSSTELASRSRVRVADTREKHMLACFTQDAFFRNISLDGSSSTA
jgi:hypothetical protein